MIRGGVVEIGSPYTLEIPPGLAGSRSLQVSTALGGKLLESLVEVVVAGLEQRHPHHF